jgi:RNA polymerase sigma-70 factor, ECF subfamily
VAADPTVAARITDIVRAAHGRLLALLSHRTRDIMAAEDALADAYARALDLWPVQGLPDRPEAWLLTVARNRLIDRQRRDARTDLTDEVPDMPDPASEHPTADLPDRRLGLMFVCAHPAIDPAIHTPLMLQTVLGIEAEPIGRLFALPHAAMAQRLVRAKRKIRDARIPFDVPGPQEWPARLTAVQEAIYGAFSLGWEDVRPDEDGLTHEALFLGSLLVDLTGRDPEALGLLALMTLSHARAAARFAAGVLVPLPDQDTFLWDRALLDQGILLLSEASAANRLGRFQLEAAIQSVHMARATTGKTDWLAIAQLHRGLLSLAPTLGAAVGYAAAVAEHAGPATGLAVLDGIKSELGTFQPAWALRAHCLARLGRDAEAAPAYQTAIALCTHLPQRRWLEQQARQSGFRPH